MSGSNAPNSNRFRPILRGGNAPYRLQSIFILPENKEMLIRRIRSRAPIGDMELQHRIASMEKELTYAELCDAQIVNAEGKLEEAVLEVEDAVMRG